MKKIVSLVIFFLLACGACAHITIPPFQPGMEETLHADERILSAFPTLISQAESEQIPDEQKSDDIAALIAQKGGWPEAPAIEIKTADSKLYLVSIGYALMTQPSSLYLFYGRDYTPIDTGSTGRIQIIESLLEDSRLTVEYNREPGSTRPEMRSATLVKKNGQWSVEKIVGQ